jgi:hypothetical protein
VPDIGADPDGVVAWVRGQLVGCITSFQFKPDERLSEVVLEKE